MAIFLSILGTIFFTGLVAALDIYSQRKSGYEDGLKGYLPRNYGYTYMLHYTKGQAEAKKLKKENK